ncbi:hypothetical protein [Qaidamihabitans albus]|uniref:hypothetical protein n=1 Tax=Qaidamihabitans albus TaxID=2795733 RepID=UPI0018F1235D|nr:hypothetical protein [Qaidamihabitans albus]
MSHGEPAEETYSPWTLVNVVFGHLAERGLHPTLGDSGDPAEPAAALLRALGITPAMHGDSRIAHDVREELAELRTKLLDEP